MLTDSYIRRKRWEHKEAAITLLNLQAEVMSGATGKGSGGSSPSRNGAGQVTPEQLFAMMGVG